MCTCHYDEPAQFVREEFRMARKAHRCSECGRAIRPGEEYAHITGLWDGRFSVFKHCMACWGLFLSLTDAGWCPEYGGLHETYHCYIAENQPCDDE